MFLKVDERKTSDGMRDLKSLFWTLQYVGVTFSGVPPNVRVASGLLCRRTSLTWA